MQQSTLMPLARLPLRLRLMLHLLASLRLTLGLLLLLLAGTVLAYTVEAARVWGIVVPLVALAVNLMAAIAVNTRFRRQTALLAFHLSLLALIALVAIGRLTALGGHTELTVGGEFDGRLVETRAGPWHHGALADVRFTNMGFEIDYAPGLRRGQTRNRVQWTDRDGHRREAQIGDQTPLTLEGYRFYTSFNKGFAPLLAWRLDARPWVHGAVHLPAYPLHADAQMQDWVPPGADRPIHLRLVLEEAVIDATREDGFRLPESPRLVVRDGNQRHELRPGEVAVLASGQLRFDGLTSWMGYTVFYDWTLPWLGAAAVVAIFSLGFHFWRKFAATAWDA
ncbi:cytochrome c biogenesis protein ResB [Nitrogeniibacter aestuarii]|uniref:cytochrome c biogenesis protein ResB n=1 Tax=Nitrogeniibacter aestuarii TaxID=2815343 RepID=UPI001D1132DF|nr:cytochrome c biogenesis protein ResB [Nitrogeniibacter aestuarii]